MQGQSGAYSDARPGREWVPELLLASAIVLSVSPFIFSVVVGTTLFSPLLCIVRRLRARFEYFRSPESCHVAIIGAGWSGLAIAARLQAIGVPFTGFEAADDVGGTWHPDRAYPDLSLHAPVSGSEFEGFPYPNGDPSDATPDIRPSASEVHAYMRRFAERRGLLRSFAFSTKVTAIHQDPKSRTCVVRTRPSSSAWQTTVPRGQHGQHEQHGNAAGGAGGMMDAEAQQEAAESTSGPFDMAVFASVAAQPSVPAVPGTFTGTACHACEVSAALLQRITAERLKVVVVGAGRSSCDLILALVSAGVPADRLVWLIRRPYYYLKLERCFHRQTARAHHGPFAAAKRFGTALRAAAAAIGFWLALGCPRLGWRLLWALDYVWTPHEPTPNTFTSTSTRPSPLKRFISVGKRLIAACAGAAHKWDHSPPFHMGLLSSQQRRRLHSSARAYTLVVGEPSRLASRAIAVEGGSGERTLTDVDVVLWATGYRTGAQAVRVSGSSSSHNGGGSSSSHGNNGGRGRGSSSSSDQARPLEDVITEALPADATPLPSDTPLFEHILPLGYPCLALASHFYVAPGPESAREAAEYLVYHLCVRRPVSDKTMRQEVLGQWCRQSVGRHLLFSPGFWHQIQMVPFDLFNAGILPVRVGVQRIIDMWFRNVLPPRDLGLLPPRDAPWLTSREPGGGIAAGAAAEARLDQHYAGSRVAVRGGVAGGSATSGVLRALVKAVSRARPRRRWRSL